VKKGWRSNANLASISPNVSCRPAAALLLPCYGSVTVLSQFCSILLVVAEISKMVARKNERMSKRD